MVVSLILFTPHAWCNEVNIVYQESKAIVKHLANWDNEILRVLLERRYEDNDSLLELAASNELIESNKEVDDDFNHAINKLLDDQKGLNYFTEHLVTISTKENLNLDEFLLKTNWIRSQFEEDSAYISGEQGARTLINRLIYLSLMEKYTVS
ncbi:hypothetical protein NBRC116188_03460 [Oceaniserpentilla sp. 4NH20-0058]